MDLELLAPIFDPKRTGLLLCDMQNDFIKPAEGAPPHNPPLVATCVRLLEEARRRGMPVAYTRRVHRADGLHTSPVVRAKRVGRGEICKEGTWGAEIIDELAPRPGDIMADKVRYSGFFGTPLASMLRAANVDFILFAGVSTYWGVEGSARDAEALDFLPVVVSDACASDTAERHESSLWNISRFIGFVVTADEALRLLDKGGAGA
jgi:ureidoacrylate peracid hydrolase